MKRIIITETQYKNLINKKKTQKIVEEVFCEINTISNGIKKDNIRNDAIVETIKKHSFRGNMNENVINTLINKGVEPDFFEKAGVKII